jgi:uncharacterized protein YqhQ
MLQISLLQISGLKQDIKKLNFERQRLKRKHAQDLRNEKESTAKVKKIIIIIIIINVFGFFEHIFYVLPLI